MGARKRARNARFKSKKGKKKRLTLKPEYRNTDNSARPVWRTDRALLVRSKRGIREMVMG